MYCIEIKSRRLDWHNPFANTEFHSFATEWEALEFIQTTMSFKKWDDFSIRIGSN